MNAGGGLATDRTIRGAGPSCGDNGDSIGRRHDLLNSKARRDQRQNALRQKSPVATRALADGPAAASPPLLHTNRGRARNQWLLSVGTRTSSSSTTSTGRVIATLTLHFQD